MVTMPKIVSLYMIWLFSVQNKIGRVETSPKFDAADLKGYGNLNKSVDINSKTKDTMTNLSELLGPTFDFWLCATNLPANMV